MATKRVSRTKHNAGHLTTTYNNETGQTRKTTSVKTGNYTRSRSRNANGTIRTTTTHRAPNGFVTRKTKTIGSKPSRPKKPKFIKPKVYKAPKVRKPRAVRASRPRSSRGRSYSRRGSSSFGVFDLIWLIPMYILKVIWNIIWFVIKWGIIVTVIVLVFAYMIG